ncbi:MAG: hypothetical protein JNL79_16660 [Myxococcales bacterium]|nr:hypothetical protein [Myxococcales bacterium]
MGKMHVIGAGLLLGLGCRTKPPELGPGDLGQQMTVSVWLFGYDPIEARQLSDKARSGKGLIAVRLDQGKLDVLQDCFVPGTYTYRALSMTEQSLVLKSHDEAKATLPLTWGTFSGEFSQSSSLEIRYKSPGDYTADVPPNVQLAGSCAGATHVVSYVTVGAFYTQSGAKANVGGSAALPGGGPGVSGGSGSEAQKATSGGNMEACNGGSGLFGGGLSVDCSTPLKITLRKIDAVAAAAGETCNDSAFVANQNEGFHFDGKVFTIEADQLRLLDEKIPGDFACTGQITPAELKAFGGVVRFLDKHKGVRAHVSVNCTPLIPLGPMSSNLHLQAIMGHFASAGLSGRLTFSECTPGFPTFLPVGNGVAVELEGGCTDMAQPPPRKCNK